MALDERRMAWALGLAATQPVGLREMFGTMTKSFHPGRAAQNGLLAAVLAEQGFTSSEAAIEAKRGWANVTSARQDYSSLVGGLGSFSELLQNSYKPFACGLVIHPSIDGCIQLRDEHQFNADDVASVELSVHPLVLELTGKPAPATGLDGKFSVFHGAAVAIIDGRAGDSQFSDERVRDAQVMRLRDKVRASVDGTLAPDAADVIITLTNGERLHRRVVHAVGSAARPMTDGQIDGKFDDLVTPILGAGRATRLRQLSHDLDMIDDVGAVAREASTAS